MDRLPDLPSLSRDEKDALIHALWAQVQALTARVAESETKLGLPPKTPNNSSLPPSQGRKPNRDDKPARTGPRQGSLGRERSEEHTSELQSRQYLVCRLLLEKKKKNTQINVLTI